MSLEELKSLYPRTLRFLSDEAADMLLSGLSEDWREFPEALSGHEPAWLSDLAVVERAWAEASRIEAPEESEQEGLAPHPSLVLAPVAWKGLPLLLHDDRAKEPEPGQAYVCARPEKVWEAGPHDLLALKAAAEGLTPEALAAAGGVGVAAVEALLRSAQERGVIVMPRSLISRPDEWFAGNPDLQRFQQANVFTLQWHVTQACDLACRHCYDRTERSALPLGRGLAVLDQLSSFCAERRVRGQVSFTGGNPFMYKHFYKLYQEAVDRGLTTAVLGNPVSRQQLEHLIEIRMPAYYQVSLEGLEGHNDDIRGPGHFKRSIEFLELMREFGVPSVVMLTLTRANQDQLLELAKRLEGLVGLFTFNRLSQTGEGASLAMSDREAFPGLLQQWDELSCQSHWLGLKDNFLNLVRQKRGAPLFGGCTGYGCGAAFNFLSLTSDGELHACRKFPSPVGNIFQDGLAESYDSPQAKAYRAGPEECNGCAVQPVCRGCLAVTASLGLDPCESKDPYCFLATAE